MSTVANEDPQESANRLVPKSLALSNSNNNNGAFEAASMMMASNQESSRTTASNRGSAQFADGWPSGEEGGRMFV